jgi:uncharacterized protein involved in response to NO
MVPSAGTPRAQPRSLPVHQAATQEGPFAFRSYLIAAFAIALTAGFGMGAYLAASAWVRPLPGTFWGVLVQMHGHAQLFGWAALFVFGILFHVLPRMRGAPPHLARPAGPLLALYLLGLLLRLGSQAALAARPATAGPSIWALLLGTAAVLELLAGLGFAVLVARILRAGPPIGTRQGLSASLPLLILSALSYVAAVGLAGASGLSAAAAGTPFTPAALTRTNETLALYGFLLGIAFGVSARMLPLFLTVPGISAPRLRMITALLAVGIAGRALEPWFDDTLSGIAGALGSLALAGACLWYIWELDLPLRRRPVPWLANLERRNAALRAAGKPDRGIMPDSGEYGRFEWTVVPAHAWLALAGVLALAAAAGRLLGWSVAPLYDAERHAVAVGYLTALMLGMAVRLLPNFTGRRLQHLRLVDALAISMAVAAVGRVGGPLLAALGVSWALAGALPALAGLAGLAALIITLILILPLLYPTRSPHSAAA